MQNARFEKAVDMATDPTSEARRGTGFHILEQILLAWGKSFDDSTEKNVAILTYIATNNFQMEGENLKVFRELYKNSKTSHDEENGMRLFEMTHELTTNNLALNIWIETMARRSKKFNTFYVSDNNFTISGLFSHKVQPGRRSCIIFSGMNLRDIQFFVLDDDDIHQTAPDRRANFSGSCFIQVEMQGAIINHVDFSKSHLFRINDKTREQVDCNMRCIGTIFDEANLIDCNFRGADFKDAFFIGTNISGSDFRLTKNLTPEQFQKGAYWIKPGKPRFPESFPDDFASKLPDKPPTEEMVRMWEIEAGLYP